MKRYSALTVILLAMLMPVGPASADGDAWYYGIKYWNRTCGPVQVAMKSPGIGCRDMSKGCQFPIGYEAQKTFSLVFKQRVDTMTVGVSGNCTDGTPGVITGACQLPLNKMFPYMGYNIEYDETDWVGPWPDADYMGDDLPLAGMVYDREVPNEDGATEVDIQIDQCVVDTQTGNADCEIYCRPRIEQFYPSATKGTDPYSNLDWCPAGDAAGGEADKC